MDRLFAGGERGWLPHIDALRTTEVALATGTRAGGQGLLLCTPFCSLQRAGHGVNRPTACCCCCCCSRSPHWCAEVLWTRTDSWLCRMLMSMGRTHIVPNTSWLQLRCVPCVCRYRRHGGFVQQQHLTAAHHDHTRQAGRGHHSTHSSSGGGGSKGQQHSSSCAVSKQQPRQRQRQSCSSC
jgi:hypothetical protein